MTHVPHMHAQSTPPPLAACCLPRPAVVLRMLQTIHGGMDVKHVMSVEINDKKREFIRMMCPELPVLVQDITTIDRPKVLNNRWSDKLTPCELPAADYWFCGFSCTSISSLNTSCSSNRAAGLSMRTATGSTWHGQLAYVRRVRPRFFINENVPSLANTSSNDDLSVSMLDGCLAAYRQMGYVVGARVLNPLNLGLVQSRPRIYLYGVLQDEVPQATVVLRRAEAILDIVHDPSAAKQSDSDFVLDDFLLPEALSCILLHVAAVPHAAACSMLRVVA